MEIIQTLLSVCPPLSFSSGSLAVSTCSEAASYFLSLSARTPLLPRYVCSSLLTETNKLSVAVQAVAIGPTHDPHGEEQHGQGQGHHVCAGDND